jgi:hypothetical protein
MIVCNPLDRRLKSRRGSAPSLIAAAACLVFLIGGIGVAAEPTADSEAVAAHLAAGEFGAALDVAQAVEDPAEQTRLIEQVVTAQVQAGEFQAARTSARHIQQPRERVAQRGRIAGQQSLAGGTGANFDALIELIQNQTEGPWQDLDGIGGTMDQWDSGVRVDPHGLLYRISEKDLSGELAAAGLRARKAALNTEMARPSALRMVSLTRLEKEVAERVANGESVVESMQQLAGLSQIQYVFIYPDENEIVIAGPAEGWRYDETGRAVGDESGRPTLQLDDLVTVLRTFTDGGRQIFGCSIDPRPEGLKAIKEFAAASQARGPLAAGTVGRWAQQLGQQLGRQDITVYGIPGDSRVARVIVEADYRMKLIGVGKLDGGPHVPDYFDLLAKNPQANSGSLDALRWWLTMQYESVLHSDDHNAFEVRGSSVKCQSENQFITSQGQRVETGKAEPVNQLFAANFTQNYADLARRDTVFADLQGVFDLALVAALLQHERVDERIAWDLGVFAVDGGYRPASYAVPKETDTVVNHRVFGGKDIVVQVAGGVRADLMSVLTNPDKNQPSPRLAGVAQNSRATKLPEGRWWWDAQ